MWVDDVAVGKPTREMKNVLSSIDRTVWYDVLLSTAENSGVIIGNVIQASPVTVFAAGRKCSKWKLSGHSSLFFLANHR